MPYYNPDLTMGLQIRDRLRDLLEADDIVRTYYPSPKPIGRMGLDDITAEQDVYIALTAPLRERFEMDASGSGYQANYNQAPLLLLTVQKYATGAANESAPDVLDDLVNITGFVRLALTRYRGDPRPLVSPSGCRLWDQLEFDNRPDATQYELSPSKKFWYSHTYLRFFSYNRGA